ncbi:MAG: GNAT family N-acetyltransferase [Beijerinckiaceae bacterium]
MGTDRGTADGLILRRARETDLPAIVALLAADSLGAGRETTGPVLSAAYTQAFAAINADTNQILCVGELDGEVVATMQISFIPGLSRRGAWRGQIEAVRVSEAHRGHRIGERLMEWAIAACRSRGCRLVQLTSDASRTNPHRFYERLGFTPSHVGFKLQL